MFPVDATGALQLTRLPRGLSNFTVNTTILSTFYASNNKLSVVQKLRGSGRCCAEAALSLQHAGEVLDSPNDVAAVGAVPERQQFIDTNSWDC